MTDGRLLFLSVGQNGALLDVSYQMPLVRHSPEDLASKSLGQLLDEKIFSPIDVEDYQMRTVKRKFNYQDKALVALGLGWCLMDFVDEEVDLARHSWNSDSIYFFGDPTSYRTPEALHVSFQQSEHQDVNRDDPLDISKPGNPILLSFARLLLEIYRGRKIQMAINPESRANLQHWFDLVAFLAEADPLGNDHYIKAVDGCLSLYSTLRQLRVAQDEMITRPPAEILRRILYQEVVKNLQLAARPQYAVNPTKRKRQSSGSEVPSGKRPSTVPQSSTRLPSMDIIPNGTSSSSAAEAETTNRPRSREDFEIAIICALTLEFDAMCLLVDEFWEEDGDKYGRAVGDKHTYTTGRIGRFNVVLALLPEMGQIKAAGAAAALRASYPRVDFAIVTGICGGVPFPLPGRQILLGDVVISNKIVQYDFGRQYPDGLEVRDAVDHSLVSAPTSIGSLLATLQADRNMELMKERTGEFLRKIQEKDRLSRYRHPGADNDRLFPPHYQHRHRNFSSNVLQCDCGKHERVGDPVCPESRGLACSEVGCDLSVLKRRDALEVKRWYERSHQNEKAQAPAIFVGTIGSGNNVIKSGVDRDAFASKHNGILAFEMEAFGVWNSIPCIMVKSVCDYADSHKNKDWQQFAAATAAAATKALLQRHIKTDTSPRPN